MKQLKTLLTRLLVIVSLMLPWAATEALETFERNGFISAIGYAEFTVKGKEYRIASGAKLKSEDPGRKKFSDFKVGDEIYFQGKTLSGVNYVDFIVYWTPDPS
jgi:hypothetical protein